MSLFFSENQAIIETARHYFDRKLKQFGNLKYAYMVLNKKNPADMLVISNYPKEWVDIYKENNYQQIDPVVIASFTRIAPFSWDESITINTEVNFSKIFNLSKNYKIANGHTFILHDYYNNLALLSILMNEEHVNEAEAIVAEQEDKLQMLLIKVHEKIISLYKELENSTTSKKQISKDIFSPRENEILYWASVGKTYQEIALILGIKVSTVKFHIGNVVKKLGVMNAKHAIRMGVELQLIKPAVG
ncbi:helix-turn-helix transcriptional regulator [Mixta intestinalis]|jgi:LuxR family quorum-sensing system transcriptional regulator ExpR|uniref:Transcriptional activator protein EsaR n=1 Tax=Mixta intestinalis TaxID=1615494 RepID=A0A6P1Q1S6_9GAMM|nr:LuxR family transcriptional regulator [Mixta intestinalis]QHM72371.1 Transcriptional activator protein EsaR [Mixta intestinalis]